MSNTMVTAANTDLSSPRASSRTRPSGPRSQRFEISIAASSWDSAESRPAESAKISVAFEERTVLIDLTEVTWVDSWGLALFIEATQQIQAHGGTLIFFGVRDSLERLFATTKLDRLFTIAASREEACAEIR